METIIFGVYRPPDSSSEEWDEGLEKMEEAESFAQAHSTKFGNVAGAGYFNLAKISWSDDGLPICRGRGQECKLAKFMENQFLSRIGTRTT